MVAWHGDLHDSPTRNIYAQRYAADGTPRGGEFRVNQSLARPGNSPRVAVDQDGDFVVVWSAQQINFTTDVYARRYAADGTPRGGEFRVNVTSAGYQDVGGVAMDADGDFIIAWTGWYQTGGDYSDVYARRYTAAGVAGPEFRVNAPVAGFQDRPYVAMTPAGAAVVAWNSSTNQPTGSDIFARQYGADGGPSVTPFRVNTASYSSSFENPVAVDDAGNFVVAWGGGKPGAAGSFFRAFEASGAPRGDEVLAIPGGNSNVTSTTLAADGAGNFVVTGVAPGGGKAARFFDRSGVPRGPATAIEPLNGIQPIAMRRDGGAFVTVSSAPGAAEAKDVYARRYTIGEVAAAARVVGRHVFYRHNSQGYAGPGPLPSDDVDIAADKRALLPGETPSIANVTSYSKGINGLMVDIAGLRADSVLGPGDFDFGTATPPGFAGLRRGAGVDGSDRYTFLWNDSDYAFGGPVAPSDRRVTVTSKAPNLGLARDDVFSFGNLIGETGDGTGAAGWRVSALDLAAVKRALNTTGSITSNTDFNRDGRVNALDLAIVKRNLNHALALIPPMAAPPPAPAPAPAADPPRRPADDIL